MFRNRFYEKFKIEQFIIIKRQQIYEKSLN